MNDIDDDLKNAFDYVNQCSTVHDLMVQIASKEIDKSNIDFANERVDYLLSIGDVLLDRLEIDYKIAGWWKKKVVKSWINDVGIWASRIKITRGMLNHQINNFEMNKD